MPKKYPPPPKAKPDPVDVVSADDHRSSTDLARGQQLRAAIETGDGQDIARLSDELGLHASHLAVFRVVVAEIPRLEQLIADGEGAAERRDALELTLVASRSIPVTTIAEAETLAKSILDLERRHSEAMQAAAMYPLALEHLGRCHRLFGRLIGYPADDREFVHAGFSPAVYNAVRRLHLDILDPLGSLKR